MYEMLREFAQRLLDNNEDFVSEFECYEDGRKIICHDIVRDNEIIRIRCDGVGIFESIEVIAC